MTETPEPPRDRAGVLIAHLPTWQTPRAPDQPVYACSCGQEWPNEPGVYARWAEHALAAVDQAGAG